MKTKFLAASLSLVALGWASTSLVTTASAADATSAASPQLPELQKPFDGIHYQVGVQDMWVPDVDSHTFGVNVSAAMERTLRSGTHLSMDGDMFLDFDQDHLDPDHIPVWWQLHFGLAGPIMESATPGAWHLSWVADANTRVNTVSSVEREIRAVAGLAYGANLGPLSLEGRLGGGYFFLEIDDDVPVPRGYARDDLRNTTWVFSPALEAKWTVSPHFKLLGRAQEWHDGDTWLETKYLAALDWDLSEKIPGAALEFSVEFTRYNIAVYHPAGSPPGYLPVLPWDDDRLFKLSFDKWW